MKPASISLLLLAVGGIARAQSPGPWVTVRVPKAPAASRPDVLIPPIMLNGEREIVLPGPNGDRLGVIQPSAQYCLQELAATLLLQDPPPAGVIFTPQYYPQEMITITPQYLPQSWVTTPPKEAPPVHMTITPQAVPQQRITVQPYVGQSLQYFVPDYSTPIFPRTDVALLGTTADKRIKFSSRGTSVKQALDTLLKGTGIGYRLDGAAARTNAKVRIALENVRLASALDVITQSVNLYWSVVKVSDGPGVQRPLVVISDHPSQTAYQLLDGFDANQWGDYDQNGNRYWAIAPNLQYDIKKFNDSVRSYDYQLYYTPNIVPPPPAKKPNPAAIRLADPRILNLSTQILQEGGQNQNVMPMLLGHPNTIMIPYAPLLSSPNYSTNVLGQASNSTRWNVVTLSTQEVHSTFTCPHCGKKTTVVRTAGKTGNQAPWKFCPFCGKPVK